MQASFDYIVLGSGIVGLTIAKTLVDKNPKSTILIIEKEVESGLHGSGRNSGVMHSGIYYPSESLKAVVCAEGSAMMTDYCEENGLPVDRMGKVIVPGREEDDPQVDLLYERAKKNGATVSIVDEKQLHEIEPFARTASGRALHSPNTAVVDPKAILKCMIAELKSKRVVFSYSTLCQSVDPAISSLKTNNGRFNYGLLFNATGQYADKMAKMFGAAEDYTSLPFKGLYFKLSEASNIKFNGLIYPVPDLNVPFLGVHSVKTIDGSQYLGPTAMPAFGREHYQGMKGVNLADASQIAYHLVRQYISNNQGFRRFSHEEAFRFLKKNFTKAVQALVPDIKEEHLLTSNKVGIRAQLLNTRTRQLEMDFFVERKDNTIHVLNAVSPAFTSSLKFSQLLVNNEI